MADANKEEVRRYWDERDAKVALIRRLWTYRSEWFASSSPGQSMDLDAVGYTLGVSSVEALELCELGILPAKREGRWKSWRVSGADLAQWLKDFGPEWFQARTDKALADIAEATRNQEEARQETREDLLNALDALRSPEERAARSTRLNETLRSMMDPPEEPDPKAKITEKLGTLPSEKPAYTPREALDLGRNAPSSAPSAATKPKPAKKKGG